MDNWLLMEIGKLYEIRLVTLHLLLFGHELGPVYPGSCRDYGPAIVCLKKCRFIGQ